MEIRQETRCRKCSPKNRAGDYGHDERLSYQNPSSPRRHTSGGGSLVMRKVVLPLIAPYAQLREPDPEPNLFQKLDEIVQAHINIYKLKNATRKRLGKPTESPVKEEPLKQEPKTTDAPIDIGVVEKKRSDNTEIVWEGGSKFNCGEQKSRTLSPRRKTARSQRNLR